MVVKIFKSFKQFKTFVKLKLFAYRKEEQERFQRGETQKDLEKIPSPNIEPVESKNDFPPLSLDPQPVTGEVVEEGNVSDGSKQRKEEKKLRKEAKQKW